MGFFDRFRRRPERSAIPELEVPGQQFAFVLLREASLPPVEALEAAFEKYATGGLRILRVEEDGEEGSPALTFQIEGSGLAIVMLLPAPVPDGEAESAFEASLSAFRPDASLEPHRAHLMVTLMGLDPERPPVEGMQAMTSLLAAVIESCDAIGVYWGNAGATHAADFFRELAVEEELGSRLALWTGVSRAGEPDGGFSLLSLGMNQFGLPDLYLVARELPGNEALGRFFDLLAYVVQRNEAIPDGDTIGPSDEERIVVRYVPSPADDGATVWRVEI